MQFWRMHCAFICHLQYVLFRKVRVQNPTSARSYIQFERLDGLLAWFLKRLESVSDCLFVFVRGWLQKVFRRLRGWGVKEFG